LVGGAQAQAKLTNIGTLTCTTGETAPQAKADAKLSCRFQSLTGQDGGFEGYIARKDAADLPPGKRVLVWTVLALKPNIELRALAGTYTGETGGQTAGRLKGGADNNIALEPFSITSQVGDNPVPSVLELRLDPVKV
jgi:hypothetical protein